MKLVRCKEEHFYDEDRFPTCPHCSKNKEMVKNPVSQSSQVVRASSGDNDMTISFWQGSDNRNTAVEPVVGWLVCVKGKNFGADFRLKTGRNFVGRDNTMDVYLKDEETVSREKHVIIVYEPKQNIYLIQSGSSDKLVYLNGNPVLSPTRLRACDEITVGDVKLIFTPFCSQYLKWADLEERLC